ncbi:MAG: C-GCAxxG-C-C family protein [Dehalococcoidia bacterium]|jgi:C_GCAxxG_C_C family probable redox protein
MTKDDDALATFKSRFNCSQAVLSSFCEELGFDMQTALKVAAGFGGGIGRSGQTCGAVTGAIMVIGLKKGMSLPDPLKANEITYGLSAEFLKRFRESHGSTLCHDLLGCDISNNEALMEAREKRLFQTVCPKLVQDAVRMVGDMLQ